MAQQAKYTREQIYRENSKLKEIDQLLIRQIDLNLALGYWVAESQPSEIHKYIKTIGFYTWAFQPRVINFGYWALKEFKKK